MRFREGPPKRDDPSLSVSPFIKCWTGTRPTSRGLMCPRICSERRYPAELFPVGGTRCGGEREKEGRGLRTRNEPSGSPAWRCRHRPSSRPHGARVSQGFCRVRAQRQGGERPAHGRDRAIADVFLGGARPVGAEGDPVTNGLPAEALGTLRRQAARRSRRGCGRPRACGPHR